MSGSNARDQLRPYLPRLLVRWLAERPEDRQLSLEGSLVFVDVSGFTNLSERLAKRGKVGAEELTDAIGTCFSQLLAVAYEGGGSLIKFGGDALLLLFADEGHAVRAAQAAVGMRRTLRDVGRIETAGGRVRLRMSVGVHTGTFHFFLAGDSHRELMVTGPAVSETVTMEGTADAGEILVSPATAAALPERSLGDPKGPGRLLKREPTSDSVELPAEPTIDAEQLLSCIPVAVRAHLLAGELEPEHRRVSIAFIHYDGTDELIERSGPEAAGEALDELVREVQRAADRQRVSFLATDIDHDGGKIILAAGAPQSPGNDEERMLLALREILEGDRVLPVRIGVNRGQVFAGAIGPHYRRTYTVMGDAVNLAARLMAKAEPGQLISTRAVLNRSRTVFQAEALPPFTVKGKAKPVEACSVGEVTGSKAEAAAELPLVGREQELEELVGLLLSARRGRGRMVEISGGPGIGKSRLLQALIERADETVVLSATCELYESSTPYFPFRTMLRRLVGISEDESAEAAAEKLRSVVASKASRLLPWLPLIAIPFDVEVPPTPETEQLEEEFLRPRLARAVGELLEILLPTPTLLSFENAHWMDEPSSDLLRHLEREVADRPWLACTTRRDGDTGFSVSSSSATLRPEPLGTEAAAELVQVATEEDPLSPHEVTAIVERSGGNPLFLQELVSAARSAGGTEGLPDSVEALVIARIDRLAPEDRSLLRRASVLGQTFSLELLDAVLSDAPQAEHDLPWDHLDEFIARDGATLRFRQALVRDAAYEALPFRSRRELHGRAGEAIEKRARDPAEEAELLSLHFFHAQRFEEAWRYSKVAGERAQAIYANVEAATFFERAISAANRLEEVTPQLTAQIHEALGDVRNRIGLYAQAGAAYRAARRSRAGDPVGEARLLLKESWIPERAGRYSQALRWLGRGLKVLDGLEGPEAMAQRAQLMVWYASVRQGQGRHEEAIEWCRRAIEEAEAAGERDALAHAYYILDWAYNDLGRPDLAVCSTLALEIYEDLGDLGQQSAVLNNMGVAAYYFGSDWGEALDLYRRAREACLKTGDEVNAAFATLGIGEIYSDQGRLKEAEAHFRDALRIMRASDYRSGIVFCVSNLGRVAARSGRFDEAMTMLDQARRAFRDIGEEVQVLETEARIAECHLLKGESSRALSLAEQALEEAERLGGIAYQEPALHRIRGYALMQQRREEEAEQALRASLDSGRTRGAQFEIAMTLVASETLARLSGRASDLAAEADGLEATLEGLGITSMPEIPLPSS